MDLGQPALFEDAHRAMSEREFQKVITGGLTREGWLWSHVRAMRTEDGRWLTGTSSAGFPDLVAVRAGWVLACELKSARGRPTPEQVEWLTGFAAAGALAWCLRSTDSWTLIARWISRPEIAPERWGW